ncbi:hypothetical protein D3C83_75500 [compost metagenome]
MRAGLAGGRQREEEARVEAPRAARRRDPVAVVGDLVRVDIQVFLLQKLAERQAAGIQFVPERFQVPGAPWIYRQVL